MHPASSNPPTSLTAGQRPPALALDIGGSTTRIGIFPAPDASPEHTLLATFPTAPAYDEHLAHIASVLEGVPRPGGIGVSFGGRVARDGQRVAVAPNLPDYEGKPLACDLAAHCGGPVRLAHDPVCGLLAEKRFGALVGADRCAYLTVSTGTGAALQLGKEGPSGPLALTVSIEIGHQILPGNQRFCLCGQVGCLETYTGGKQLAIRYDQPLEELDAPQVWDDLTRMLAIGLINLAQLSRVELIALGGGIALHRPTLAGDVQRQVNERIHGARLRLVRAQLGEQAPLVGAALLLSTPEESILH